MTVSTLSFLPAVDTSVPLSGLRVAVLGAGAVGAWIAGQLALAGENVTVLARGESLSTIERDGIWLLQNKEQTNAMVVGQSAKNAIFSARKYDLIVVAVKAQAMHAAALDLAPLLHSDSMVMTAMNGVPWWFLQGFGGRHANATLSSVDPGGAIAQLLAPKHVLGCVVHASRSTDGPGRVRFHGGNKLIVGEPAGGGSERVQRVASMFKRAGFEAPISEQIQKDIWFKLWGNMTMNPISALTGCTIDLILKDDLVRGYVSAVMLEAKAIGAQLGIPITDSPEDRHAVTAKLGAFKTSMLQDVQAGRAIELDALVGAVRELGVLTGVATPHTDSLLGLTRLMAQQRGLY